MTTNPKNFIVKFEDAERVACKASILIEGLPGMGKSGTALIIARVLSGNWEDVYGIDTENGSMKLFRGIMSSLNEPYGKFKKFELTGTIGAAPTNFIYCRDVAVKNGAKVVIEDSISHAWQYKGGVLEMLNEAKERSKNKNDSYAAWGDPVVMAEKNALLDLIRSDSVHVISTVRLKEKLDYEEEVTATGTKKKLVSLGDQQIQQGDLKYEPDLVLRMLSPGGTIGGVIKHPKVVVMKSRYAIFEKDVEYELTPGLLFQLKEYLEEGVDPETLLEAQRLDYINAIKAHLDANPSSKSVWKAMKDSKGYADVKLEDIDLKGLRGLYAMLLA